MTFRYTRFGFINSLISLIPIFPVWTLFPGVGAVMLLEKLNFTCEYGYEIVMWTSILLAAALIVIYLIALDKINKKSAKEIKLNFRLTCLLLYFLINTFAIIKILGPDQACHGDGQTLLACIYSGPIATLSILVFGIIVDLYAERAGFII